MAYPNKLPESGPIEMADVFEYFKGGLLDSTDASGNVGLNLEGWPYVEDTFDHTLWGFLSSAPSLPMTRGQFYDWIDVYSSQDNITNPYAVGHNLFGKIGVQYLYEFGDKVPGWPEDAVISWAKIKSLEFMIFGSWGNGGDRSATSSMGSGDFRSQVANGARGTLYLMRYALNRFDTYGECHDEGMLIPAPPSNMTINTFERSFDFTYSPGYESPEWYEYSTNGSLFQRLDSKPQVVNTSLEVPVGQLRLRLHVETGFESPSPIITNSVAIPAGAVVVDTNFAVEIQDILPGSIQVLISKMDQIPLGLDIDFYAYVMVDGYIPHLLGPVTLAGNLSNTYQIFTLPTSHSYSYIEEAWADPEEFEGQFIQITVIN